MPLAIPAELKKIRPYIRRAEELDRDSSSPESRLVAYYCRQYAVHAGIPLASTSAAAKTALGHILENLEKEKPAMDNFTKEEAAYICRDFAMKVFDKADEEDRAGSADKNTAKAFYASVNFIEILEQFKDVEDSEKSVDDRKKIIYAKWKATDILKAIKEGRAPTPGGFGDDDEAAGIMGGDGEGGGGEEAPPPTKSGGDAPVVETVDANSDDGDEVSPSMPPPPPSSSIPPPLPPAAIPPPVPPTQQQQEEEEQGTEVQLGPPPPAYPGPPATGGGSAPAAQPPRPPVTFNLPTPPDEEEVYRPPAPAPAPYRPPAPAPAPAPAKKSGGGMFGFGGGNRNKTNGKVSKEQISDATELTKFALAALEDKEVDLAAERLQQALQAMGR